jgi:hypothetical protein
LAQLPAEPKWAAIGMSAKSIDAKVIADFLVDACDALLAEQQAEHDAAFKQTTAHDVPVPPLRISALAASHVHAAARVTEDPNGAIHFMVTHAANPPSAVSTPRQRMVTSTPQRTPRGMSPSASVYGSTPRRGRDEARGAAFSNAYSYSTQQPPRLPSGQRAARSPGLSSTYLKQATEQMKLERLKSETEFQQQRRKAFIRHEYDRERSRSRSRSRSPGASSVATGASAAAVAAMPKPGRPALWEPKSPHDRHTRYGGLGTSERQFLHKTFGESAHRSSYLPASVRSDAYRAANAGSRLGGLLNPTLHSAFERLDSSKRVQLSARAPPAISRTNSTPTTPRHTPAATAAAETAASPAASTRVNSNAARSSPPRRVHQDAHANVPGILVHSPPGDPNERSQAAPLSASADTAAPPSDHDSPHDSPQRSELQYRTSTGTTDDDLTVSPRLSVEREAKMLADFHRMLEADGLRPDGWAGMTEAEQDRHFDDWRCARAMRRVVRQAYADFTRSAPTIRNSTPPHRGSPR